jgi:hypothetical protein
MSRIGKTYPPFRQSRHALIETIVFLIVAAVLVYFVLFDGRWEWPPPWGIAR